MIYRMQWRRGVVYRSRMGRVRCRVCVCFRVSKSLSKRRRRRREKSAERRGERARTRTHTHAHTQAGRAPSIRYCTLNHEVGSLSALSCTSDLKHGWLDLIVGSLKKFTHRQLYSIYLRLATTAAPSPPACSVILITCRVLLTVGAASCCRGRWRRPWTFQ